MPYKFEDITEKLKHQPPIVVLPSNPEELSPEAKRIIALAEQHRLIPNGYISPRRVTGYTVAPEGHEWTNFALSQVEVCRTWLRHAPRTKRPNPRASSSYGFKHTVERWAGGKCVRSGLSS